MRIASTIESQIQEAVAALTKADAILMGAGAGMGVDSGLPDFRGDEGFWRAYPPYARLGLGFFELANPRWFATDPTLAWGFYGHRLNLYRTALPHAGFQIALEWARQKPLDAFVFTSNVDGQFQQAGWDEKRIVEIHGSIHWLQCTASCGVGIFLADEVTVVVEEASMRAREPLPSCPVCGTLARPNILMFSDADWEHGRAWEQEQRLQAWLAQAAGRRVAIIECGAGKAVPTVRSFCEQMADKLNAQLIRINVREPDVPAGHIALPMPARAALEAINQRWRSPRTLG